MTEDIVLRSLGEFVLFCSSDGVWCLCCWCYMWSFKHRTVWEFICIESFNHRAEGRKSINIFKMWCSIEANECSFSSLESFSTIPANVMKNLLAKETLGRYALGLFLVLGETKSLVGHIAYFLLFIFLCLKNYSYIRNNESLKVGRDMLMCVSHCSGHLWIEHVFIHHTVQGR